jgi:hypothetical protein
VRRNLLAPGFFIPTELRRRAERGQALLADAVRDGTDGQHRLFAHDPAELLSMATALHTAALMSDAELMALREMLAPRQDDAAAAGD